MQCISNWLIERHCLIEQAKTRRYVSRESVDVIDIYDQLKKDSVFLNQDTHILYIHTRSSNDVVMSNEVSYLTCVNSQLRDLAKWCNTNLLAQVAYDSRPTLDVRIRIATSMLNKIDLDIEIANFIHDNIVQNTLAATVDYSVESLPF